MLYTKKYVHCYCYCTVISSHVNTTSSTSTHPLNSQTVQKRCFANQERSILWKDVFSDLSWMRRCFQICLEWGESCRGCRREFQILAAWKWKDPFPADLKLVWGTLNIFSLLDQSPVVMELETDISSELPLTLFGVTHPGLAAVKVGMFWQPTSNPDFWARERETA